MKKSIRQLFINIGMTFVTLLVLGLFFECIVFEFVFKASDLPILDGHGPVIKYRADQEGIFRVRDEVAAKFTINHNGWNSFRKEYLVDKNKPRIAIVGDSYLAAFQVGSDASVAEKLEKLGHGSYDVYRFGISGAPLSQYLLMLREEVIGFKPDLVIFNLVHNDFDESYDFMPGVYSSSFLKLKMDGNSVVGEIMPAIYSAKWYDFIRRSNIWRYFAGRRQIRFQTLRNLILGKKEETAKFQANINITSLENKKLKNLAVAEYVFGRARELCEQNGAQFMVVMDGVRQLIYEKPEGLFDRTRGALVLNDIASVAARRQGVSFLDLHDVFARHYREHGQKFEFEHDGHWNELGHEVAAEAIYEAIREQPALLGQ